MDIRLEKLKEVIHYIISESDNQTFEGSVRLMKLLWYSDTSYFYKKGISITGYESYVKEQNGPVLYDFYTAKDALIKEKKIEIDEGHYSKNKKPDIYKCIGKMKYKNLNDEERKIIKNSFEILKNQTSSSISNISHETWWDAFSVKDELPISIRFIVDSKKNRLKSSEIRALF